MAQHLLPETITISLTRAEAVVLEDFISRWETDDAFSIRDRAEQFVLYTIHHILEAELDELNDPGYADILRDDQDQVRAEFPYRPRDQPGRDT